MQRVQWPVLPCTSPLELPPSRCNFGLHCGQRSCFGGFTFLEVACAAATLVSCGFAPFVSLRSPRPCPFPVRSQPPHENLQRHESHDCMPHPAPRQDGIHGTCAPGAFYVFAGCLAVSQNAPCHGQIRYSKCSALAARSHPILRRPQ